LSWWLNLNLPVAYSGWCLLSEQFGMASGNRMTKTRGNGCAASWCEPRRATRRTASKFERARADFKAAWQVFSSKRTPADYRAWRDQRDWTARKYAMWERGERLPSQMENR